MCIRDSITPLEFTLAADSERNELLKKAETETLPERISEIQVRLADIGAYSAPAQASSILHGLGFNHTEQKQPLSSFSGGWRMRVAIAAVLFSKPEILLLDEPTNDLDVTTLRNLENAILDFNGCVLVISHDRFFLDRICTHLIVFEGNSKVRWFEGNFEEFQEKRKQELGGREENRRSKYKKLTIH